MFSVEYMLKESAGKILAIFSCLLMVIISFFASGFETIFLSIVCVAFLLHSSRQLYKDIIFCQIETISGECIENRLATTPRGMPTGHIIRLIESDNKIRKYRFSLFGSAWRVDQEHVTIYFLKNSKIILGGEGISKIKFCGIVVSSFWIISIMLIIMIMLPIIIFSL